ncbi:MAG: carboxylating nicotinate-nucleotide diphosphorylase [Magnetococcus sp. WYHC-3]
MISLWSDIVKQALAEDIGRGDITTNTLVGAADKAEAVIVAKEDFVVCGLPVLAEVFREVDNRIRLLPEFHDGDGVRAGNTLCTIRGPARGILIGERVALNFFQNLSAVATLTTRFVAAVEGTGTKVFDTRKTTPGIRLLQKYAVRVGGGYNHRMGLDDGMLVKENHIKLAGGITRAVRLLRETSAHMHRIEVECETLEQVREALDLGVDVIMLDNMDLDSLSRAVAMARGKALLEASGGINLNNARSVAETGVDMISIGALTHSAGNKDVSLLITA